MAATLIGGAAGMGAAASAAGGAASVGLGSSLMTAMGGPIGIGLAGLQVGLGLMQQDADNKAKQQQYLNQKAFQEASTEFNTWQASMNARRTDLNQQYKFWGDTVRHNQNFAYTQQMRGAEFAKEIAQSELVFQTRASAMADYASQSAALQAQLQERGMAEAVAVQQYRYRALQASASYQASGQEGQSMDRYVNNYARQAGDYAALKQIEAGLREQQYTRAQQGKIAEYLSKYNSQQFYQRQPYMDPIAPFAPLPTLVNPPGPTMLGARPGGMTGLQVGSSVLGGIKTGLSFGSSVGKLSES